jgi:hypothetical protein
MLIISNSSHQAGKLHPSENENPATIRSGCYPDNQAFLGNHLFLERGWGEEEPKSLRGRRRRRQEEPTAIDQPFSEPEEVEQGVIEEDSLELGQTY